MKTLREAIEGARSGGYALGHFNISDSNQCKAIVEAARETGMPVIIGVSDGERKFIGTREVVALVKAARESGVPVFLNSDHTKSIDAVKEVIDAGFDAVLFDGSHLPENENIEMTRAAVQYARDSGRDVLIEGEIGRIGTSSKLLDAPPEDMDVSLTTPDEAARFVRETSVDLLAPAIGSMHGRLKSGESKAHFDAAHISSVHEAAGVPLVLHGASGEADADMRIAIQSGASIVHINTDIRIAYRKGIEQGLSLDPNEVTPYKFLAPGVEAVKNVVAARINFFAGR